LAGCGQGRRQQLAILRPRYLDGAEDLEMLGDELGIEQQEAAELEAQHEMDQATLLASRSRLNMLSPKKAPPMAMP